MRRLILFLAAALLAVLIGGSVAGAAVAMNRSAAYASQVSDLSATWTKDTQEGVPASSLAPLRAELAAKGMPSGWFSTTWLNGNGGGLLSDLNGRTASAWNSAMAGAAKTAQGSIDEWNTFAAQETTWVDPQAAATAAKWPAQLSQATTPKQLDDDAAAWHGFTVSQRAAVTAAQKAKLNAELAAAGGPQAILTTAGNLERTAQSANLDDQGVGALASQLAGELNSGADATDTAQKLVAAVNALQALVNLNNQVDAQVRPLHLDIDQTLAEGTPNANALNAQFQQVAAAFRAASSAPALNAVATQFSTLQSQTAQEISANQCGHSSYGGVSIASGKAIAVSLSLQEMIFYQDGCAVQATPTTSGRPQLPTPTGVFHVFYKTTPFEMISPWPVGSPFYYYPTWVKWVMEFDSGGYFIHDAYWEPQGDFGPGSQDIPSAASHGCIHIPTDTMQWAYSWTPVGTPVVITG